MKHLAAAVLALALPLVASSSASAQTLGDTSLDLRIGPSIGIVDAYGTQTRVSARVAYNVARGTSTRIMLEAPLDIGFGAGFTLFSLLPGVRVEIPVSANIPLYITPSAGVGMGLATSVGNSASPALGVRVGVGVRYVFQNHFHLSFDPVNVELYPVGLQGAVPGFFNVMFGAGVNF